ncbi:MAG TPA: hypothetical protein VFQ59_02560 [Candidatus Paceibacterota bacterium]|nr:hypothetical protein [Candidatus Paceibacterota bacterium]
MKKAEFIAILLALGVGITAVGAVLLHSFYLAWACILLIAGISFQSGVNNESTESTMSSKIRTKGNGIGRIIVLVVVYKIAIGDHLNDGWMKYATIAVFVIANISGPYTLGHILKKHFKELKFD